jgi:hypothetical protein
MLAWAQTGAHSGNDTVVVPMDGVSSIGVSIVFEEWTGPPALTPPSDQDQNAPATGTSVGAGTISTGNVTTTAGGELCSQWAELWRVERRLQPVPDTP